MLLNIDCMMGVAGGVKGVCIISGVCGFGPAYTESFQYDPILNILSCLGLINTHSHQLLP